jgi:SAM-dependent methyltransferase
MEVQPELRPDFAEIQRYRADVRTPERLRAHYVLERSLGERLKNAPAAERAATYGEVYDTLFQALPDHPQHLKRSGPEGRDVSHDVSWLLSFTNAESSFVEIGCGDAAVSFAMAAHVHDVVGIDVQDKLLDLNKAPSNFRFVKLREGNEIPLPSGSVDVVASDQLLEHLHPQDVAMQLSEVARILKPGGVYICTTPNAVTGPHDITMYFGYRAAGLHLHEYTYKEFRALFRSANFRSVRASIRIYGRQIIIPVGIMVLVESAFLFLPRSLRNRLARTRIVERIMGINAIAQI